MVTLAQVVEVGELEVVCLVAAVLCDKTSSMDVLPVWALLPAKKQRADMGSTDDIYLSWPQEQPKRCWSVSVNVACLFHGVHAIIKH